MLLTAHRLGALRYGELPFITHNGSFWRILGAKKGYRRNEVKNWSAQHKIMVLLCACVHDHTPLLCVSPFFWYLPLATNTNSQKGFHCLVSDCSLWTEIGTLAAQQHLLTFSKELSVVAQGLVTAVFAGCVSQDRVCGHWVRSVSFFQVVSMT